VTLRIVDVRGRVVRTLLEGAPSAIKGAASWDGLTDDGRPAPGGVYWAQLRTTHGTVSRRIVRIR
ncbi:hypothetical protein K8I85_13230, partial [bacterium]|nr:hypothetical protein [bacterium]